MQVWDSTCGFTDRASPGDTQVSQVFGGIYTVIEIIFRIWLYEGFKKSFKTVLYDFLAWEI